MAKLVHIKGSQVKAASAKWEKLLAKDPVEKRERTIREKEEKAEKAKRNREFAASQPKPKKRKGRAKR